MKRHLQLLFVIRNKTKGDSSKYSLLTYQRLRKIPPLPYVKPTIIKESYMEYHYLKRLYEKNKTGSVVKCI
jgi:hypothetical protein